MSLTDEFLSRLKGTLQTIFGVGTINLKDNSGVAQFRNTADSAYVDLSAKKFKVQGTNATNAVILDAPSALSGNITFILPDADGGSGDVIVTDGSGGLSFATIGTATNANKVEKMAFSEADTGTSTILTAPANGRIERITVRVSSAAGGGSPTLSVDISGGANLMDTDENNLKLVATYILSPGTDVGGTPVAIELTIVDAGQTFAGDLEVEYSNPS